MGYELCVIGFERLVFKKAHNSLLKKTIVL